MFHCIFVYLLFIALRKNWHAYTTQILVIVMQCFQRLFLLHQVCFLRTKAFGNKTYGCVFRAYRLMGVFSGLTDWQVCFQGLQTDGCVFRAYRLTGVFSGLTDWWVCFQGLQTDRCVFRAYRLMGVFSGLTDWRVCFQGIKTDGCVFRA